MSHSNPPASKPKILAVASGKGGVGKSTLTLNLGIALAKAGKRVAILDLDIGFGNLETLLGANSSYSIVDVKEGRVSLDQAMMHGPFGLRILAGGSGLLTMLQWDSDEIASFLKAVETLDSAYEFVLLDTGAGLTDIQAAFLLAADETMIVTTPEPTALTDAYSIVKMLHHSEPDFSFQLVVNQCASISEGKQIANQFSRVCNQFLQRDIEVASFISKDPDISTAVKRQIPYLLYSPRGSAAKSIERLAHRLMGHEMKEQVGLSGLLKKWINVQ